MHLAGAIRDYQVVGINTICRGGGAFENVRFGNPVEREGWHVLFEGRLEFNTRGIRQKSSNHDARAIAQRMHAEHLMRRAVLQVR